MSNRFKDDSEIEAIEEEDQPKVNNMADSPKNFFATLLTDGGISTQTATNMLPFVVFIALLAMFYIGNHHQVETTIRKIDKLNKEVAELNWDYKTLKAELMLKSTQTEVSKKVDSLGLIEPVHPPKKIVLSTQDFK